MGIISKCMMRFRILRGKKLLKGEKMAPTAADIYFRIGMIT